MSRIALIDCGSGNLFAAQRALERVAGGAQVYQCFDTRELERADKAVLTGSGQLPEYLEELYRLMFVEALCEFTQSNSLLATNLGMLALGAVERASCKAGLKLLPGEPKEFNDAAPRVPHMGWSNIQIEAEHWLFAGFNSSMTGYFAHSMYLHTHDEANVLATTEHGDTFPSIVSHGNVVGLQFLPENSGKDGLQLLANFVSREAG